MIAVMIEVNPKKSHIFNILSTNNYSKPYSANCILIWPLLKAIPLAFFFIQIDEFPEQLTIFYPSVKGIDRRQIDSLKLQIEILITAFICPYDIYVCRKHRNIRGGSISQTMETV